MPPFKKLMEACLLITYAGDYLFISSGVNFVSPFRISQERAAKHYHITLPLLQCSLGYIGESEFAHSCYWNFNSSIGFNFILPEKLLHKFRNFNITRRGHRLGWMREPVVVVAAEIHINNVNSCSDEILKIIQCHLNCPFISEFFQR